MPEISVIVPVYKAEQYVRSCIGSILSQTFLDFELILVDDGSPDNSGAICEEYASKDARITVLHQTNQGQAAARNHAMGIARGEWICFVDSDDLIHPQMLELLYQDAVGCDAGISMCRMLEAAELPETFRNPVTGGCTKLSMEEDTLTALYDADDYPAWVACAKLIRRELIEAYPFREGRVFEDNEAVCHWVCGGKTMTRREEQLYFYRTNPDSTTKSSFSLKKLDYLWALESIIRYYTSIGYLQMRRRFFSRYIDAAVDSCNGARYMLGRPDVVREIIKSVKTFVREEDFLLTREQSDALIAVKHPRVARFYWPAAGVIRTLREEGAAGLARKLMKIFRKDVAE
ncbi:MAG: glycosyltransferase family 2 protein [Oscillospiraceae bacterium]|nr:glycosyltransferase family 2 protein [Oscillospiraceae bacterium]